jgi:hypothetical protein
MADMAQATIKGRASGAGTGKPVDLTQAQLRTIFDINTASITATGSTTARTAADRAADSVCVLDYGADRTGATDCTVAVRSAIAVAFNAGKNVFFPAGTYLINGDSSYDETVFGLLYIGSSKTSLIGEGAGVTKIKCGSATASGVRFGGGTQARFVGIGIDMNGSTGFGLCMGGQYCGVEDTYIENITGTRANEDDPGHIALLIPGSTLCDFRNIGIINCANGIVAGFAFSGGSAPCQYLHFDNVYMDPCTTGVAVRVRYGSTITFNNLYVEGAPERLIDIQYSLGVFFNNLSGEIVGDYPLTTDSHIILTGNNGVSFHNVRFLYSDGAPVGKNIFELSNQNFNVSFSNIDIFIRENIGEVFKTSVTAQYYVNMRNITVRPTVAETCDAITTGAYGNLAASVIAGADMKAFGDMITITGAACDVYLKYSTTTNTIAAVGIDYKIYLDGIESPGSKTVQIIPSAGNQTSYGGKQVAEVYEAGSYFRFGTGIQMLSTTAATPEASITATPGSLCASNNGGAGKLWLKASGTGNTGWTQIT